MKPFGCSKNTRRGVPKQRRRTARKQNGGGTMRLFPNVAHYMVFTTGYTDRVTDKQMQELQKVEDTTYLGKTDYDDKNKLIISSKNHEAILRKIEKRMDQQEKTGSLIFSAEEIDNKISMSNISMIIENLKDKTKNYCGGLSLDAIYLMENKDITFEGQKFRVLYMYFDTESG